MECEQIEEIEQLLLKYLCGDTNQEEEKQLQEWQAAHPAYQQVVQNLQDKSFFAAVVSAEGDKKLYQEEWRRLRKQTIARRKSRRMRWVAAAAAVLIPILVSIFLIEHQNPPLSVIPADNNQAIIYWADGKITPVNPQVKEASASLPDTIRLSSDVKNPAQNAFDRIVIPRGAEYIVRLDDGTVIHLSPESQLEIPVHYSAAHRSVNLRGGAYFEVAHDTLSPFVVCVRDMKIRVLGTGFDVRAYEEEENILTTLVHGKVSIHTPTHEITMHPGMQAVVKENGAITLSKVNVSRYTAWVSGKFIFENERLEDILKEVGRWYNIRFHIKDTAIADLRMTMNLPRYQNWMDFIHNVEKIEQWKILSEGDRVWITR